MNEQPPRIKISVWDFSTPPPPPSLRARLWARGREALSALLRSKKPPVPPDGKR